jgi:hypothetical protein
MKSRHGFVLKRTFSAFDKQLLTAQFLVRRGKRALMPPELPGALSTRKAQLKERHQKQSKKRAITGLGEQ